MIKIAPVPTKARGFLFVAVIRIIRIIRIIAVIENCVGYCGC